MRLGSAVLLVFSGRDVARLSAIVRLCTRRLNRLPRPIRGNYLTVPGIGLPLAAGPIRPAKI
jgi:hypothetical protein